MRKILLTAIVLLAAGCGGGSEPVTVTPELEARQKEDAQRVQDAESMMQKQQRQKAMMQEQRVNEAESARQKRR